MREEQKCEQEEKKKKENEQAKAKRTSEAEMKIREESVQKGEKRKGMSVFVQKNESAMITRRQLHVLMYKNVYFSTNNFNPSLYNVVVSILQEFAYNGKKSDFVKVLPAKFWANIERKN